MECSVCNSNPGERVEVVFENPREDISIHACRRCQDDFAGEEDLSIRMV